MSSTTPKKIKVFIADDHLLLRRGLIELLSEHDDFEVAGETGDPQTIIPLIQKTKPQILLLDIQLPQTCGLELIEKILEVAPKVKVIILSGYSDDAYKVRALLAGAWEYLTKTEPPEKLIRTIREIAARQENTLLEALRRSIENLPDHLLKKSIATGLTPAEIAVLDAIKDGKELKEAAALLNSNPKTLQFHLSNIYTKLNVSNRSEAVYKALQLSIISID